MSRRRIKPDREPFLISPWPSEEVLRATMVELGTTTFAQRDRLRLVTVHANGVTRPKMRVRDGDGKWSTLTVDGDGLRAVCVALQDSGYELTRPFRFLCAMTNERAKAYKGNVAPQVTPRFSAADFPDLT